MSHEHDILIVGGGPVGATLALALRGYGLSVSVLEARPSGTLSHDPRALALSLGSRLILQRLGVWRMLESDATPIATIHVSQRGRLGRTVLRAEDEGQDALGYVLSYAALSNALDAALAQAHEIVVERGARAVGLKASEDEAVVHFERDGTPDAAGARLIVLADGGRSLDLLPDMHRKARDYGQNAVVAHVECELPHGNVAFERFTPEGPVALLPEGERGYALVWTATPDQARVLCEMAEPEFLQRLHHHFGDRAGKFLAVDGRATFPLKLNTVRPVTSSRLAVVGNAAQTLHPVAGQGFNLGLRDAWELALTVSDTARQHVGDAAMLARYRTRRRFDTGGGIFFTDFLVRSFSNDFPGLGMARGAGLAFAGPGATGQALRGPQNEFWSTGMTSRHDFDVVVIGGGLVGAATALALRGNGLRLALVETADPLAASDEEWDNRIYAISPGNAGFLSHLGVWESLDQPRIAPIEAMHVWEMTLPPGWNSAPMKRTCRRWALSSKAD